MADIRLMFKNAFTYNPVSFVKVLEDIKFL